MIKLNRFSFVFKLSLLVMVCFSIPDEGMGPLELHQYFLQNSPFKETKHMAKLDRFAQGLTPDRYFEEIYELTIDPSTGSPDYSSKQEVLNRFERQKNLKRNAVPGQSVATPWYTIGPNNEAGRARAALFDLADGPDYDRVIAGGVSGGLWENTKISDENQPWSRIEGVPGNLAVSIIVQDEDSPAIMYVGTGESYTSGDASGNGIYKSINGGTNWTFVFGNNTQTATQTGSDVDGYFYINDMVLYDHDDNSATPSHIFAALGSSGHNRMDNSYLDTYVYGLYKSTDSGSTWSKITSILSPDGITLDHINDLEVQAVSNRLWMSSTRNIYGKSGGSFWYSDDGTNFTKASPTWDDPPGTNIWRTEIAPSTTDTDTHYILAQVNGEANFYKTSDNFATIQTLPEPIDQEDGISTTDFTRGQSSYDLEIEIDPNNDNIVYAGGINWHRSEDGGQSWSQISKWAPSCLSCWFPTSLKSSIVHADQHGLYFHPSDSNKAIVVNDGGVAYASSLSTASSTSVFTDMEDNFITTQFYRVAQTPPDFAGTDLVIGGTQDNGTFSLTNPQLNKTNGTTVSGGDGAATFFDQIGGDYMITNYVYNNSIDRLDFDSMGNYTGSTDLSTSLSLPSNEGSFINPAALDSYNDVYFSNAGDGNIRVITDLDGTPTTFVISNVTTSDDYVTSLEVSRHTTQTTTLFVGLRSGGVKKITNAAVDGGSTISTLRTGAGSVSDIHIGETEDDIYITYYNYGLSGNVLYSSDGGTTFNNKEGDFPNIPVFSILHNPYESEEVIIGTELGVWRTADFSSSNPSWSIAEIGMSDVAVYDMVFRGTSALDNRVVAATYGRGIYVGSFEANTNPPISQTDSITVAEGGTATTTTGGATSVLANDSDPDGDPITSSVVTNPLHFSAFAVDSTTGTFTYTHDGSETTTDTFFYRAFDGAVYGETVSVTINITPVNDCPIVANPVADRVAQEDAPDEIISLLDVFTDAENNSLSLTVSVTNSSLISTAYNNGTGSLTLDYADNAFGTATVTINVNDGNSCTTTKDEFVVTVNSVNDIPVANPESISVAEGGTATTTTAGDNSLLDNDTDADSMDTITTNVVSMPFNYDTFRVNSTTGTFTYIHNGSETTTDSFSYRVLDGNGGSSQIVTTNITISPVNDCPSVVDPVPDFIAQEDDPDDIIDLTNRFLDPENNTLNITVNNANTALLTETYNPVTQEITLDYIDDQVGTATITINIDDNNGCTSTQDVFVVTVVPQNDAPVGVADTIAVDEGATATTTTAGATSVLANDTDMENDVLDAALLTPPLNHNGMFSLAQNGTFTYEHDGSETTTDSFTYTLSDGVNSLTVTVTINISPQNDCPRVISPIASIIVDEDADDTTDDLSLRFTDDDIRPFPNSLSFSVSPTNNDLAVLSINGAGLLTIDYKDNQTGTVTITVSANDNVDCIVNDVFLLTVDPLNDAPVGVADTITVDEAGTATQTTGGDRSVLTNDTDIDNVNSDLTASIVSIPSFGTLTMQNSGTFIYVHDGSETTTDSFVYKPNDGNIDGNDVTVNITINPINDCPEFGPDLGGEITAFDWNEDNDSAGIYNLGSRLVDPDSSPLTYTVTWTNSSVYGINQISTGNFDFVPVSNAFGSSVATITVDDMEGCVLETTFTVNVYSVNDCPTVDNPIADISVNEDADDYWIDIRNTFSDIESSTLNFSAMSTNNSLIATSFTATSLIIDFLDNQNGSTNVVLTVTDGDPSCTVDDVFSLTIASVNDLPLTVTEEISVVSGGTVSSLNDGITTSLLANDIDADGNPLTANLITPPINGTLTLQTNGTFVYTHNGSSTSTDTFYYAANDGYNNGNTVSVTIYINNPPVAVADTIAVLESGTATKTTDGQSSLLWNDTDADASDVASLTAVKITDPSHGSLTLNSDGTFTYVHNGDDQSSDSFTYSADDGKIVSSPITVSIAVTGTNDTPVAYDDTIIVPLGGTATTLDNGYTSFATNDIDPDGDTLTVSIVSSPSYGTISLNPGGTFSYVQNGTINAGDSFTYKVNDGSLDSNIANVNVYLSCTPCTESIIEAGVNGVSFTYTDCLCKTVRVYVPRGKAYSFCHLDTSINVVSGSYALISSSACN
ncbi:Ig-like domain-containing protein [Flavobacteriaceae bacterium]|nr:Ig-like domain-containing protein [Flavobacteriaceae bacterium]